MHASLVLQQTSPGVNGSLNKSSLFILKHGWAPATIRHYAAAVNRYFKFMQETSLYTFPTSKEAIYNFVYWCRENHHDDTVLSTTTKKYLTGLKMWHVLHDADFPVVNPDRIRLLLKASRSTEVERTPTRSGLTLMDLNQLVEHLPRQPALSLVLKGILLVGFWGLARLGELTFHKDHPLVFIRRRDVSFDPSFRHATIRLRMAKTASHGEIQLIRLTKQPNHLDPVGAIRAILDILSGRPDDPLFPGLNLNVPMKREVVISLLDKFKPRHGPSWSGHSLRIGGASLRAHCGSSVKSLQRAGRWRFSCYKLYIHCYNTKTARETSSLAAKIKSI